MIRTPLRGFQDRSLRLVFDIDTPEEPVELEEITFRVGPAGAYVIEKDDLEGEAGGNGVLVPLTLSAEDMGVPVDVYRWELLSTVLGDVYTLAYGRLTVAQEPT